MRRCIQPAYGISLESGVESGVSWGNAVMNIYECIHVFSSPNVKNNLDARGYICTEVL